MKIFNYADIKSDILKEVSNIELSTLLNTNQVFDVCVQHFSILTFQLLKELKFKMLFASILKENKNNYPSVHLFYDKEVNEYGSRYLGLQLKCRSNFPIYFDGRINTSTQLLHSALKRDEIYLIRDFNEVIKILNINDYEYYNKLLIKEELKNENTR